MKRTIRLLCLLLLSACLLRPAFSPVPAAAEGTAAGDGLMNDELVEDVLLDETGQETPDPEAEAPETETGGSGREAFIDDIIALGRELYEQAGGKLQRAHYKGDIYVCKNFTVYLFRQTRDKYRMAEYPEVQLRIPNNLPAKQCKPYAYGYCWEEIAASDGNPFEQAAQFLYDTSLSREENLALARAFMAQTQKGDYFQMTGDYSGGKGAHSAIFISDYDPITDTVHSMDSNRTGKRINGLRYGRVLFDSEMSIDEWVGFFCRKKCGATLYRLRDDIIQAE